MEIMAAQAPTTDKIVPWLALAFGLGTLTAFAMIMLAFRLYVSITHPYWIGLTLLGLVCLSTLLYRNRGKVRPSMTVNVLVFSGQVAFFTVGALATFYVLMSFYPPNFQ